MEFYLLSYIVLWFNAGREKTFLNMYSLSVLFQNMLAINFSFNHWSSHFPTSFSYKSGMKLHDLLYQIAITFIMLYLQLYFLGISGGW